MPNNKQIASSVESVKIYGAATLERYTKKILIEGFEKLAKNEREICHGSIYQIHGNVDATSDDNAIMSFLKKDLSENPDSSIIVLLHRPDEVQDRLPRLQEILKQSPRKFGLVFLGDMHIEDPFYSAPMAKKEVVPHGFFDITSTPLESNSIVIGTHTTWGDMRDTKHLLQILGELFRLNKDNQPIRGYIGGKPTNELSIESLHKKFTRLFPDIEINFLDAKSFNEVKVADKRNIIFVDNKNEQPDGLEIIFNTQMYFYGEKVRTGESSGSLHASVSIPVILEMNGSEKIERLDVIKVPYNTKTMAISSADFSQAASQIITAINSGSYTSSLQHNLEQAKNFNNSYVANQLNEFFLSLAN